MIRYFLDCMLIFPLYVKKHFKKNYIKTKKRRSVFKSQYKGPKVCVPKTRSIKWAAFWAVALAIIFTFGKILQNDTLMAKTADTLLDLPEAENSEIIIQSSAPEVSLTNEEYELLARLVTAEAEDQGVKAQYMVACVIMNRIKSNLFPDKLEDVIWQDEPVKQFTSMWNGRFEHCRTTSECYAAIDYLLEYGNVLPDTVLYFTSEGYLPGTIPYMQVNQLYFSRQKIQ